MLLVVHVDMEQDYGMEEKEGKLFAPAKEVLDARFGPKKSTVERRCGELGPPTSCTLHCILLSKTITLDRSAP